MTDVASPDTTAPALPNTQQPPASAVVAAHAAASAQPAEPDPQQAMHAQVAGEDKGMPPGWYADPADSSVQRFWDGDGYVGDPIPVTTPAEDVPEEPIPQGALAVPIGDASEGRATVVYVIDRKKWPSSAVAALRGGDYETWAEECLARDVDFKAWLDLDPRMGEIELMFEAYAELTGATPGKSRNSRRSLMRMRRG